MKTFSLVASSALALSGVWAAPASAATLLFELSGPSSATFTLEVDPVVPDSVNDQPLAGGSQIFFDDVSGLFNGTPGTADINFGTGPIIAALNINSPDISAQLGGTDLFSFVDGQAVFNLGTFAFFSFTAGRSTLTISEVQAAVPEPATWAMLLLAFGMLGGAMRHAKRKQTLSVSYA